MKYVSSGSNQIGSLSSNKISYDLKKMTPASAGLPEFMKERKAAEDAFGGKEHGLIVAGALPVNSPILFKRAEIGGTFGFTQKGIIIKEIHGNDDSLKFISIKEVEGLFLQNGWPGFAEVKERMEGLDYQHALVFRSAGGISVGFINSFAYNQFKGIASSGGGCLTAMASIAFVLISILFVHFTA